MKKYFLAFVFVCLSLLLQAQHILPQRGQQPNIIFFLVDDMGWQDTSVPFWEQITPANI